jgi:lysophospholipase L1-like esterase
MNRTSIVLPLGLLLCSLAACTSAPEPLKAPPAAVPAPATAVSPVEHKEPPVDPEAAELQRQQQARERQLRQDWPNLARYREANAQAGLPAEGKTRVVFMGDSITDFWVRRAPEFFAGKPYLDRGISGQTTPQMLLRFRQDVVDLKPKVVVILAGTNDIAGNTGLATPKMIEDNLQSMAELAQANGIRPVFASVLPAARFGWSPDMEPGPQIAALNAWIKDYTQQHHLIYLDYYSAMVDEHLGLQASLSKDGVHPNEAGYAIMGPLAEEAIARALTAAPLEVKP